MKVNIVLVEPEIPQNAGNIARTCAATGGKLHLVKPYGFSITDKYLKRAGLDYWDKLDIEEYDSFEQFLQKHKLEENAMFFATTKGTHCYSDINYTVFKEIYILFGKETKGLPEDLLKKYIENTIRIPMKQNLRSLNLANSVAIVIYEVLRQDKFRNLQETSQYLNE